MSKFSFENDFIDRRQTEYAIIIYLPENLDQIVVPFREKYDPIYNQISSHLTLVFPFYSTKSLEQLSTIIKSSINGFQPIEIELDSIDDFYPKSPVIYWSLKENQRLCDLYFSLYLNLDIPIPHKKYVPHATVAREISPYRVETVKDSIASYLPIETFQSSSIDLVTPLANDKWVSVRTFPLSEDL